MRSPCYQKSQSSLVRIIVFVSFPVMCVTSYAYSSVFISAQLPRTLYIQLSLNFCQLPVSERQLGLQLLSFATVLVVPLPLRHIKDIGMVSVSCHYVHQISRSGISLPGWSHTLSAYFLARPAPPGYNVRPGSIMLCQNKEVVRDCIPIKEAGLVSDAPAKRQSRHPWCRHAPVPSQQPA